MNPRVIHCGVPEGPPRSPAKPDFSVPKPRAQPKRPIAPAKGAPAKGRPAKAAAASAPERVAEILLGLLLLALPFVIWYAAKEAFRLPKLLLGSTVALASLVPLAWKLRTVERIDWRAIARLPVVQALAPLLLIATLGLATTDHPLYVREGLVDLWIGAAALAGWSLGLAPERLRRLLDFLVVPAVLMSLVAVLQYHDVWEPLRFVRGLEWNRLGVTALAGNPGDLGAFWVLPCLVAQDALASRRRWRWLDAAAIALGLYTVAITQSLTALIALGAGSVVFWGILLPRRRALAIAGGIAAVGLGLILVLAPLRLRVTGKLSAAMNGDLNSVLTGRLDGWRTALWMVEQHPALGVGHGAYRAAFGSARLELVDQGVKFFRSQENVIFANAHNEYLEAAAEWGIPGVLALAWALYVLVRQMRRLPGARRSDAAVAWAGVTAYAVMSIAFFPFRIALTAFPGLLLLAWIFAAARRDERA